MARLAELNNLNKSNVYNPITIGKLRSSNKQMDDMFDILFKKLQENEKLEDG